MSTQDTYTPHPNSARWPFYAMVAFAVVCCVVMWRGCEFSDGGTTPAATETASPE